jgi:hypothetical protein
MERHANEIMKLLEKVEYSGYRSSEVFRHWLSICEATLVELPNQVAHVVEHGKYGEDSPETQELFSEMRERYARPDIWEKFTEAFSILLDSTGSQLQEVGGGVGLVQKDRPSYQDVLGDVYMQYAYPNPGTGQYFTPWNICYMMAGMLIGEGEKEVHARIKDTLLNAQGVESALAEAVMMTSVLADTPQEAERYYFEHVIPTAVRIGYEPIKIIDPCVGSGRMLLAAAAYYPGWITNLGLVQFYGQDIDPTCVQMTRVNMMLYGLDARFQRCLLEAAGWEGVSPPPPEIIEEAKEAEENGDHEKVARISASQRNQSYEQLGLFDLGGTENE